MVFKAIDFVGQNLDSYITQLHSIYCREENENVLFTQLFSWKHKPFFGRMGEKWQKLQNITKFQDCCFSSQNRWILWVFNIIQQLFFNWKHNSMIFKSSSINYWLIINARKMCLIHSKEFIIDKTHSLISVVFSMKTDEKITTKERQSCK